MLKDHLQRPIKIHATADIAVSELQILCQKQGWAAETIFQDYGEDLLVQPTNNEDGIEHFKIWFQVKGTSNLENYKNADGSYTYPVSFAHAYKWLRNKDLCVVVLWNVQSGEGLYFLPRDEIQEWSFYTERKKNILLRFQEGNLLNSSTIQTLAWKSRIEHYFMLIASARLRMETDDSTDANGAYLSIVLDFLKAIGVFEKDTFGELSFSNTFEQGRKNAFLNMQALHPDLNDSELFDMACALAMIVNFEERSGNLSFPSALVEYSCEFIRTATVLMNQTSF